MRLRMLRAGVFVLCLAPLAWLRGSWEDVSDGLTISMQCDWAAEGGFLIHEPSP